MILLKYLIKTKKELKLSKKEANNSKWEEILLRQKLERNEVKIVLVGKYVELFDAYIFASLLEVQFHPLVESLFSLEKC